MVNGSNSSIKCGVSNCAHHNVDDYCDLQNIKVGCTCDEATQKCDTECLSFECGCNDK